MSAPPTHSPPRMLRRRPVHRKLLLQHGGADRGQDQRAGRPAHPRRLLLLQPGGAWVVGGGGLGWWWWWWCVVGGGRAGLVGCTLCSCALTTSYLSDLASVHEGWAAGVQGRSLSQVLDCTRGALWHPVHCAAQALPPDSACVPPPPPQPPSVRPPPAATAPHPTSHPCTPPPLSVRWAALSWWACSPALR